MFLSEEDFALFTNDLKDKSFAIFYVKVTALLCLSKMPPSKRCKHEKNRITVISSNPPEVFWTQERVIAMYGFKVKT